MLPKPSGLSRLGDFAEAGGKLIALEDESLPLRIAHKAIGGREVYFIINDSPEAISTRISLRGKGRYEEWDPATGEIRSVSGKHDMVLEPYHGKIYRSI